MKDFGIRFELQLTLDNQPISRFGSMPINKRQFGGDMQLLQDGVRLKISAP